MNRKTAVSVSLLALLCFASVGQALGESRVSGVDSGDYFTYVMKAYWIPANPHASVPDDLRRFNSTNAYNVTVTSVNGSSVVTEEHWLFMNGTDSPVIVIQDVASGQQSMMYGLISENIIAANLNAKDLFYSSGDDPRRINATLSLSYGNVLRDGNLVAFSYPIPDDSGNVIGVGNRVDYYDKATGVLITRYENTVTPEDNSTLIITLGGTNRWSVTAPAKPVTSLPTPTASTQSPSDSVQLFGTNVSLPLLVGVITVIVTVAVIVPIVLIKTRKSEKKRSRR